MCTKSGDFTLIIEQNLVNKCCKGFETRYFAGYILVFEATFQSSFVVDYPLIMRDSWLNMIKEIDFV